MSGTSADPEEPDCFSFKTNGTGFIISGYENVPDNAVIKFLLCVGLLVIFTLIRVSFDNYGRRASIQRKEIGEDEGEPQEHCYCCWIMNLKNLSNDMFKSKCGEDAAKYQCFQRNLIRTNFWLVVYCLSSLFLNTTGNEYKKSEFGSLTLNNFVTSPWYFWIHPPVCYTLFYLGSYTYIRNHEKRRSSTVTAERIPLMLQLIPPPAWYYKVLYWVLNLLAFIIAFILVDPHICIYLSELVEQTMGAFFSRYFISFWFWMINKLLMFFVPLIHEKIHPESNSAGCRTVLLQSFFYSWMITVLLPSLGFSDIMALFMSGLKWQCIYIPDHSALFVNVVMDSACLTALDLIRPGDILKYLIRLLCKKLRKFSCCGRILSHNWFDIQLQPEPFAYDQAYAEQLVILHMVVRYAPTSPLISVGGLLYFTLKYLVDRHNLFFVYARSTVTFKVHSAASVIYLGGFLVMPLVHFFFLVALYHANGVIIWAGVMGTLPILHFLIGRISILRTSHPTQRTDQLELVLLESGEPEESLLSATLSSPPARDVPIYSDS